MLAIELVILAYQLIIHYNNLSFFTVLPSSTVKSKQSGNIHIYISVSVAGVFLLIIAIGIVVCITLYCICKLKYKGKDLPAANAMELSPNECYGLTTFGNVAYNATINKSENFHSAAIYEEVDEQAEHDYEQI